MLTIRVVAVGKIKEVWMRQGIAEYCKRLQPFCKFEIVEIGEGRLSQNPSPKETAQVLEKEGEEILIKTPAKGLVLPLCIEGKQQSSEEFANFFSEASLETSQVTFIIGSSHGIAPKVKKMGKGISLSKMTFPHQLARLLLVEQIYRGLSINNGSKYHK